MGSLVKNITFMEILALILIFNLLLPETSFAADRNDIRLFFDDWWTRDLLKVTCDAAIRDGISHPIYNDCMNHTSGFSEEDLNKFENAFVTKLKSKPTCDGIEPIIQNQFRPDLFADNNKIIVDAASWTVIVDYNPQKIKETDWYLKEQKTGTHYRGSDDLETIVSSICNIIKR